MALVRRGLAGRLRLLPAAYSSQRWFKNTADSQAGEAPMSQPQYCCDSYSVAPLLAVAPCRWERALGHSPGSALIRLQLGRRPFRQHCDLCAAALQLSLGAGLQALAAWGAQNVLLSWR